MIITKKLFVALVLLVAVFSGQFVHASYMENKEAQLFIEEMVSKHGFEKNKLDHLFNQAQRKQSILDAISRPAEKRLEWKGYRKIFITKDRINKGKKFIEQHRSTLVKAETKFGVPKEVIAAIIGVETRYGSNKGSYRVIDALSTLAFDYPPRSKFFRSELEQVLLLAKEQSFEPLDLKGSYAGAMGYGQFIPSSYRHYAVDFDDDGVADILNNVVDAIGSVANYFKQHKWKSGQPVAIRLEKSALGDDFEAFTSKKLKPAQTLGDLLSAGVKVSAEIDASIPAKIQPLQAANGEEYWLTLDNFYVITRYNHSHLYAMAVFQLSEELK